MCKKLLACVHEVELEKHKMPMNGVQYVNLCSIDLKLIMVLLKSNLHKRTYFI